MTNIVNIEDHKPHITIESISGNCHVIPVEFFERVAVGAALITDLEQYEQIIPIIINDWLKTLK